jgi:hypothetical protein
VDEKRVEWVDEVLEVQPFENLKIKLKSV